MNKINQVWEDLAKDKTISHGLLMRRYSGEILPDVYITIQQPEKLYCFAILLSNNIDINISMFSNLQEIQVEIIPDQNNQLKKYIMFKLANIRHKDIFAILCQDLIESIGLESNEINLVRKILNRFEKWKSLFNKIGLSGLTPEEQRGLYGELYFLKEFLFKKQSHLNVLNSWVGPTHEVRDFQINNWGVEVKTTSGNNHQKVHISSERQLDDSHLSFLYLYHLSLEKVQNGGESLPQIINSIQEIIHEDTISLNVFSAKLLDVGYFENHIELYSSVGYHIRQNNFYLVENDFPRIIENEIRNGVGDVKYSIILAHCQQFIKSEEQVFETLIF